MNSHAEILKELLGSKKTDGFEKAAQDIIAREPDSEMADKLRAVLKNISSASDSAGQSKSSETKTLDAQNDSIVAIIGKLDCSTRLFNCIIHNAHALPANTAREYMTATEQVRQAFLDLPNFGPKCARELDLIMREHNLAFSNKDRKIHEDTANKAIEMFFSGIQFPDEIYEWDPSARLANLLETKSSITFFEFMDTHHDIVSSLSMLKNCGNKTLAELDNIITLIITTRLRDHDIDETLEPHLRSFMRGGTLKAEILMQLGKLGDSRFRDIQAIDNAEMSSQSIDDIISAGIAGLNDRYRDILTRRYGVGTRVHILEDIAIQQNLTRERVRQLENIALKKLRTRQTIKTLKAALKRENILQKLFVERKIIREDELNLKIKSLREMERLALDIAYGDIKGFLDANAAEIAIGWTEKENVELVEQISNNLSDSLKKRIMSVIFHQTLPLRLSKIAAEIPDYPVSAIKEKITRAIGGVFDGDIITQAPGLPCSIRSILILRDAGHALHADEIQKRIIKEFGNGNNMNQVGSGLSKIKEALMVKRGTYDLYENLDLPLKTIDKIKQRVYDHLKNIGEFISVKVLFAELFASNRMHFNDNFGPYMLLGLLHDDERFQSRRGLMIGLTDNSNKFRSLHRQIMDIMAHENKPMQVNDIVEKLQNRRNVVATSVLTALENSPEAVRIKRGLHDLTIKVFGNKQVQKKLMLACALILNKGPKSATELLEIKDLDLVDIQPCSLLGFLGNQPGFTVNNEMIAVTELPRDVVEYIALRDQENAGKKPERHVLQKMLKERGIPDLTLFDYETC